MDKPLYLLICTQYDTSIIKRIRKTFPEILINVITDEVELLKALPECDVLYLQKEISLHTSEKMAPIIANSEKLKWLHWGYTGFDRLRPFESQWNKILITNSKGLMADAIADYVILVIHLLYRNFPKIFRNQIKKVWERWPFDNPRGKTIGIIGLGSIGREVAKRAKFFQMKVLGLVKHRVPIENIDFIYSQTQLQKFLSESDVVVICVPLTSETEGLIGERAIGWMKPGSYLINVARGKIIDEKALISALRGGHIAGAALDAFTQEPLSPQSELWSLENVIITPHLAGLFKGYPEKALDLFCENMRRFLGGKDLINVLDPNKGY